MKQEKDGKNDTILQEAFLITSTDREKQYGKAEDSFAQIADYWSTYLTRKFGKTSIVHAKDVAAMMVLLKVSREQHSHKRDNLVDIAGYARLQSRMEGDE